MKQLDVFVFGTGMYVCGRGTKGYGTIMPAICECAKKGGIGTVCVIGRSGEGIASAKKKIDELVRKTGVSVNTRYISGGFSASCAAMRRTERPACAIIAVPDNLHKKAASTALRGDMHTFVVKPLVPRLAEARELIRIQKDRGLYCAVDFHKRYDEANMMLRDVVSRGTIGDPLYAVVEYSQRKSIPSERFKKWVDETNIFQYLGIHYVDIIYFVTGAKPVRAMATGQKSWLVSKGLNTYDSVEAMIEWKAPSGKKFVSTILTNWIDPESTSAMSDQKIKIVGTKGRFESDHKRRGVMIVTDSGGIEEPNPYFCSAYGPDGGVEYSGYGINSICRFLDDVADIEAGRVKAKDLEGKRPTFIDSIVPTAVLEAVNRSLGKNGEWIRIKI